MSVRSWTIFALVAFTAHAFAGDAQCSRADQDRLWKDLEQMKTWDAVHRSYRSYDSKCDDGAFAEGYSEAIVVLLAKHWSLLPELAAIVKRDPSFEQFVLVHMDATTNNDDLASVQRQSSKQCPAPHESLCKKINSAASSAIKELQ